MTPAAPAPDDHGADHLAQPGGFAPPNPRVFRADYRAPSNARAVHPAATGPGRGRTSDTRHWHPERTRQNDVCVPPRHC